MVTRIEAPFALLKEPVEMFLFDAIESAQMTLGLAPKILDAVDVIVSLGEVFGMVDTNMVEVGNIQRIVDSQSVSIDNAVGAYLLLDNWHNGLPFCIGDNSGVNLSLALEKPKDSHFASRSTTSLALARPAEIALVGFHFPVEFVRWRDTRTDKLLSSLLTFLPRCASLFNNEYLGDRRRGFYRLPCGGAVFAGGSSRGRGGQLQ